MEQRIEIVLNGVPQTTAAGSLSQLIHQLDLPEDQIAAEVNSKIVRRGDWPSWLLQSGDSVEIVHLVGGGEEASDPLVVAGKTFLSRLIVGTGKYADLETMRRAHVASGTEMVTVAVRRFDIHDRSQESLLGHIDQGKITLLPNTAGCYSSEDAVRYARLGREAGLSEWVKLEVIGDEKTLFPDNEELLKATRILVKEGFIVLPYTNDDPICCRKLEEAGAAAVMPLGAPIGSGLGIRNPNNIRIIVEQARVPVIVDAGVGTASDAAVAMELGCDGVLMNTAIAGAQDPVAMAGAMKQAVEAGRLAYRAGRIPAKRYASASSPLEGMLTASSSTVQVDP